MAVLEIEASLTDRYQNTVPAAVRRALRLRKRDKIVYCIVDEDTVLVRRKAAASEDPVLGSFLDFLARDMSAHPEGVRALGSSLRQRIRALVGKVKIDLDRPLDGEDAEE
jgi:antitoxin PrlF